MANWLSGIKGFLGGAGTGAALGSIIPGIGTAIGGGLGALGGGLTGLLSSQKTKQGIGNNLLGQPQEFQQIQNFTPEQQKILQYLQGLGMEGLENPYAGFEPIEQQALNQFNQQDVPSLAHRFTSLGNASLTSGAFQNRLARAQTGLRADLAAQKAQYGQQNKQQMLQLLLGLATQPQFTSVNRPAENGLLQNLLLGGVQAAPGLYQSRQLSNAIKSLNTQQ